METLSIILAMLGSAIAASGSFYLLNQPGTASKESQTLHDGGASKIPQKVYSACLSACGFLILLLSFLTQLYTKYPNSIYWLTFLTIFAACFYILFFYSKKVIQRERSQLANSRNSSQ